MSRWNELSTTTACANMNARRHRFAASCQELRAEYERLNRQGNLLIVVFETDAPEKLGHDFRDSAYDRWWTSRVKAIHGFDPYDPSFQPIVPALSWDWHDEVSTGHS